jgi:hypothetical protein
MEERNQFFEVASCYRKADWGAVEADWRICRGIDDAY